MKLLSILILIFVVIHSNAQVAINTTGANPHPSAMLDIQSNNRGFLPPRMNYDAIKAIQSPAIGLQVFDTTYRCLRYYNGTKWIKLVGEVLNPTAPTGEFAVYGDGAGNMIYAQATAADSEGNIYTAGQFAGTAKFDHITLSTSPTTRDAFVVKYNNNGNVVWAKQFGGTWSDNFQDVAVVDGNVYVGGEYGSSNFMIGNTTFQNAGGTDVMLVKLDANGNVLWAAQANGPGTDELASVVVDPAGAVYVTGDYTGTHISLTSFYTITNAGVRDAFVAKYSPDGVVQWLKQIGGTGDDKIEDLVFYNNTLAGAGWFNSPTMTINGFTITNASSRYDVLVFKMNPANGLSSWVERYGGAEASEWANSLTVDNFNYLYLVGAYEWGTAQIGTTSLPNLGSRDGLLMKIQSNTVYSAYAINSPASEEIYEITWAKNHLYLTGTIFNGTQLNVVNKLYSIENRGSNAEIFISRLSSQLINSTASQWMMQHGSTEGDYALGLAADPQQSNIYLTGRCDGTPASLGNMTLYNGGYYLWRHTPQ